MKMFHIHNYKTPILSRYWTFEQRNIIFQCKCGIKIAKTIHNPFHSEINFPIATKTCNNKEFELILNSPKIYTAEEILHPCFLFE